MAKLTIKFESFAWDFVCIHDIKDFEEFARLTTPMMGMLMGPMGNLVNRGRGPIGPMEDNDVRRLMDAMARPTRVRDAPPHQDHHYRFSHVEGEGDTSRQIWVCSREDCDATLTINGGLDIESARDVQEVNRDGREDQNLEDGREDGGQAGGDNQGGTASRDRPGEADSGQGQQGENRNSDRRDEGSGGSSGSERGISRDCGYGSHENCVSEECDCDCHATPEHQSLEAVRESNGQDPDQQAQDEQADTDSSQ